MSKFIELPKENLDLTTKTINQSKLELDINDFFDNDVIIIDSGTATGKTRAIGKLAKDLKLKYNCNFLSIVNLISLSREQIDTFEEESNTELKDYQTDLSMFGECDGVICLNSLYKLMNVENFDMSNTILYIDEVNDVIYSLTHNDSLNGVLNMVYSFLIKLIKSCKKIILSDATINKNTLNFISSRTTNNKTLLIKNTNKKFSGVEAKRFNDENLFVETLREHIRNKKYFLFGCDICATITTLYTNLISEFPEQKDSFILITRNTSFRPKKASVDFKDKYVFYSPSITTGVSFVYKDVKQTQFIYMSDKQLITPISFYQMASRTRNMDKLYYFCKEMKSKKLEYETIKEVENKYKKMIKYNDRILGLSKSVDENDEIKIVNNTFFKLFCYNEYQISIFKTGFLQHFENILKNNGFNLTEIGTYKKLDKEELKEFNEVYNQIKEDAFDQYIELKFQDVETEEDLIKNTEAIKEHSILDTRLNLLNISNKEEAEKYKMFIMDEYALQDYYNFLTLFRKPDYIKDKLKQKTKDSFKVKTISNIYSIVSLLINFEEHYKIDRFSIDFKKLNATNEISKEFQALYAETFPRLTSKSFKTNYDVVKIYVNIIKHICGDLPIIKTKKGKDENKKSIWTYIVNMELLKELMTLCKFNNPTLNNFNIELIEKFTGIKPEQKTISKMLLQLRDEDDFGK